MEKEIKTSGLESISVTDAAVYCDDRIAFIDDLHGIKSVGAIKTDAIILSLCLEGESSFFIDGESHVLHANELLICRPNIVFEKSIVSDDLKFRCIVLSKEYVKEMVLMVNNSWDVVQFLQQSPVLQLQPEEVTMFNQYYDLLLSKLMGADSRHKEDIVNILLSAFLLEFHDLLEHFIKIEPPSYSSGEKLFKRFLEILISSTPKKRMVQTYAEMLHVTPKYLSAISKESCGKPASDLINDYVMADIQFLLKRSDKSIKEIAHELEFPNLSFFGKYVKKHTGLSPKQYRKKLNMKEPEQ